jgi:hypothetical protein
VFEHDLSPAHAGSALLIGRVPRIPLSLHPGLYAAAIYDGSLSSFLSEKQSSVALYYREIVCTARHELFFSNVLRS